MNEDLTDLETKPEVMLPLGPRFTTGLLSEWEEMTLQALG